MVNTTRLALSMLSPIAGSGTHYPSDLSFKRTKSYIQYIHVQGWDVGVAMPPL